MKKKQNNRLTYVDLVPWVKEVDSWTEEQKEQRAMREVLRLAVLRFIWDARKSLSKNALSAFGYRHTINQFKAEVVASSINRCKSTSMNHTHNWECGVCEECLGTGRTFLLMTTRSRGIKCIACNGDGLRHQEFEQSDFRLLMSDDLNSHIEELHSMQIEDELERNFAASALLTEQEKQEVELTLEWLKKEESL